MKADFKTRFLRLQSMYTEAFGLGRAAALSATILIIAAFVAGVALFFNLAPPNKITITSGPKGSLYERIAGRYAKIIKRDRVTLKILPSQGSVDNLKRLANPSSKVDIGFVQGGVYKGISTDKLVSLGSIAYEPLFIFYRSNHRIELLSGFAGRRLAVGEEGSGTNALALTLLAANGIAPGGPTKLLTMDSDDAAKSILKGKVDAVFLMGDSVSVSLIRQLLHAPGIRLFSFDQADAYARRITYLNKITLPKGSLDLGKNIPDHDVFLLAPTVELIAREDLHPALSDLVLGAAREAHSGSGLLRGKGEFPSPKEQEIRISDDAQRFYKSGKSFLYRYLPFWVASLVNRIVAVFLPMVVLLPGLRFIPAIYRWRFRSRLARWYRALLEIERDLPSPPASAKKKDLLERLDHIEASVNRMKVPGTFADQFYGLRWHITMVRNRLVSNSGLD